jgi:HSP20 family molecular chaperone IbpA
MTNVSHALMPQVNISIEDQELVIKGQPKLAVKENETAWSFCSYFIYSAQIILTENTECKKVKAELKSVLYIVVPKHT